MRFDGLGRRAIKAGEEIGAMRERELWKEPLVDNFTAP